MVKLEEEAKPHFASQPSPLSSSTPLQSFGPDTGARLTSSTLNFNPHPNPSGGSKMLTTTPSAPAPPTASATMAHVSDLPKNETLLKRKDDELNDLVLGELRSEAGQIFKRLRRLQGKQIRRHLILQMKNLVGHEQRAMGLACQWPKDATRHYGYHATIRGNQLHIHQHPSSLGHPNEHIDGKNTTTITIPPDQWKKLPTQELVKIINTLKRTESEGPPAGSDKDAPPSLSETMTPPHQKPLMGIPAGATPSPSLPPAAPTRNHQHPHPHPPSHHHHHSQKARSSSSKVQPLELRIRAESIPDIQSTCALLETNIRCFERGFDSDATESSSGGESCDELDEAHSERHGRTSSVNQQQESVLVPLRKRALRKWAYERSAIAARWTWLQAQVADLDFRVRQQERLTKQIRMSKGLICFGSRPDNQAAPMITSSAEFHALPRMLKVSSNQPGFKQSQQPNSGLAVQSQSHLQSSPDTTKSSTDSGSESNSEELTTCARILPLKRHNFSKRRIVKSQNILRAADRKAAKYSSIHCTCSGLPDTVSPCILCSGRYDYTLNMDTEYMPQLERVALLDAGAHHVLSFPDDISLGLHFSKMLKKESTQKLVPKPSPKKKRVIQLSSGHKQPAVNNALVRKSLAQSGASSVRRRYNEKRRTTSESSSKAKKRARERKDSDASSQDSRPGSPTASPAPSDQNHHSSAAHRRRRSEANAYDINNIVIPYSIASATRVEKLQYKEIITPQWRVTEPDGGINGTLDVSIKQEKEELEDISDHVFKERHDRCEVEEKKRIISCGVDPNNRRGRSSRSRLDSDRQNSMNNGDISGFDTASQDSLITSDTQPDAKLDAKIPETKTMDNLPAVAVNGPINESDSHHTPSKISDRRRTSSVSKRDDFEDDNTPEVAPFEPRAFPLSDNEYQEMLAKCSHAQEFNEQPKRQLRSSEPVTNNNNDSNTSSSNHSTSLSHSASLSTKLNARSMSMKESVQPADQASRASSPQTIDASEEAGDLGDDEMDEASDPIEDRDWNPPNMPREPATIEAPSSK